MKHTPLLYTLLAAILYSCSYVSEEDLTYEIIIEGSVNYEDNIKPIINSNCVSCHNTPPVNGAPMSLITYSNVKNAVENNDLIGRISTNDLSEVMPFGGPRLPQNLIDLLILWEQGGLIEN